MVHLSLSLSLYIYIYIYIYILNPPARHTCDTPKTNRACQHDRNMTFQRRDHIRKLSSFLFVSTLQSYLQAPSYK